MTLAIDLKQSLPKAMAIPAATHQEAAVWSRVEYERLLAVLETLSGDDWTQPTFCTEWNVRDMVAHLAGAVTGSTTFAEFKRQNIANPYIRQFDKPIDGTNKFQIEERVDRRPDELVAEFRRNGPIAIANRQKLPWPIRKIHLPMGELGFVSIEYLMDVIYPRDQWMHRYDICAATGREMAVTEAHDGRIVALVLRDIATRLKKRLGDRTILLQLTGPLPAQYIFGTKATADCTVTIDVFAFNLRASGRITPSDALDSAAVTGDAASAAWFLESCEVPY